MKKSTYLGMASILFCLLCFQNAFSQTCSTRPTITGILPTSQICSFDYITVSGTYTGPKPYYVVLQIGGNPVETYYNITTTSFTLIHQVTITVTGILDVKVLAKGNNCPSERSDLGSFTKQIRKKPIAFSLQPNNFLCYNMVGYNISLAGSEFDVEYTLYRDGSVLETIEGTEDLLQFSNQNTIGSYSIVATDMLYGCSNNMNGSLTIKPVPTVPTYTYTACGTNQISVKGSSSTTTAGVNIVWSRTNTVPVTVTDVVANNQILTYPTSASGQLFKAKAELNGCESAFTESIQINTIQDPNPYIFTNPSFTTICNVANNATLLYTINGFSGVGPWEISISGANAGVVTVPANALQYDGTINADNLLGTQTYSIAYIKSANTACAPTYTPSAVTYTISQWVNPYINASSDGNTVYLSVQSVAGASYQWYNGHPNSGGTVISGATSANYNVPRPGCPANPAILIGVKIINGSCESNGAYNLCTGARSRQEIQAEITEATTIYPNPASDVVNINTPFESYTVAVYNLLGEALVSVTSQSGASSISTSSLAAGSYIVKISAGSEQITKPLQIVK